MSEEARRNGWRGFDGIGGPRVPGETMRERLSDWWDLLTARISLRVPLVAAYYVFISTPREKYTHRQALLLARSHWRNERARHRD